MHLLLESKASHFSHADREPYHRGSGKTHNPGTRDIVDAEDVVAHILRDLVEQVPERGDRVWHVGSPNSQSMEEHASQLI